MENNNTGTTVTNSNENIEKLLKKQLTAMRITMVCAIILVGCFLAITISIVNLVPKIDAAASAIDAMTVEIENVVKSTTELEKELTKTISEFNEVLPTLGDASEAIADISKSLNNEGLPKLYETLDQLEGLEKLQNINIDDLNSAIKSLADVVAPLARLFGK